MEAIDFKREIINDTLKTIDRPPIEWFVFNDRLHTKVGDDISPITKVHLQENEFPLLECVLKKSYLLITTSRVISIINNQYDEIILDHIKDYSVDREYYNKQFGGNISKFPKTATVYIKKNNETNLIAIIDSYYPLVFTINLLRNIIEYKKYTDSSTRPPTSK